MLFAEEFKLFAPAFGALHQLLIVVVRLNKVFEGGLELVLVGGKIFHKHGHKGGGGHVEDVPVETVVGHAAQFADGIFKLALEAGVVQQQPDAALGLHIFHAGPAPGAKLAGDLGEGGLVVHGGVSQRGLGAERPDARLGHSQQVGPFIGAQAPELGRLGNQMEHEQFQFALGHGAEGLFAELGEKGAGELVSFVGGEASGKGFVGGGSVALFGQGLQFFFIGHNFPSRFHF